MSNNATFNTSPNLKLSKKPSFGEEVANSVTHAVGAMAMLVLLPITAVHANNGYGMTAAVGMSVFVISLFLMFLSSAIYHAMDYNSPHKMVLRIIDHSMIYIAIAGSYTPVALSLVGGWLGYSIIILQWGTTIFGILYKIFAKKFNEKFSLFLYLMMGWLVIFIIPAIVTKTGPDKANNDRVNVKIIGDTRTNTGDDFVISISSEFFFSYDLPPYGLIIS